jgi:CYTH domain-containing protein
MGIVQYFGTLRKAELAHEFERRFELAELPEGAENPQEIIQGYLARNDDGMIRIRKQEDSYTMTAKYFEGEHEAETEISKEIFEALWPETFKHQKKIRYEYKNGDDHEWCIDVIEEGGEAGKIVAEVETKTPDSPVDIPEHFDVIEEITK